MSNRFVFPEEGELLQPIILTQKDDGFQSSKKPRAKKERVKPTMVDVVKCTECGKEETAPEWQEVTYGKSYKPLCVECTTGKLAITVAPEQRVVWKAKCSICKSVKDLHYLQSFDTTFKLLCAMCLPK
uniref:Uncharacterized protein n=1 Tax=Clandestinovirus TaxID=2831644 RepID=A0A8F8KSK3_9VIRU|nr:hypothetical protein KOM_12_60 [Clandestinovirus]